MSLLPSGVRLSFGPSGLGGAIARIRCRNCGETFATFETATVPLSDREMAFVADRLADKMRRRRPGRCRCGTEVPTIVDDGATARAGP
jgi:hypothetical protein